jgi:hypothetical protein
MSKMPMNTSATQIETYRDCNRKWYFNKIMRLPRPSSPSADRGIAGHEAIEKDALVVMQTKEPPPVEDSPFVRYVEVARRYGPQPGEPAGIEMEFSMPTAPGLPPLIGKIDVFRYNIDPITIVDWKFISDARYAKTETELYDDLQTNIYTERTYQTIEARKEQFGVEVPDSIHTGLVYFVVGKDPSKVPKKGPKHLPVFVDLTRKNTARVWSDAIVTIGEMKITADFTSKDDVPPNPLSCTKYGGCPYRAQCGLPTFSGFSNPRPSGKGVVDVSFYQDMVNKGLAPANGHGAGVPVPQPAPAQPSQQPQQGWPGAGGTWPGAGAAPAQPPPPAQPVQQQGWPGAPAGAPPASQQGWPGAGGAASTQGPQQGWPGAAPAQPPPQQNWSTGQQQQGWSGNAGGTSQQGWPGATSTTTSTQVTQGIISPDAPPRETGAEPEPGAAAEPPKRTRKKKGEAVAEQAAPAGAELPPAVTGALFAQPEPSGGSDGFELYVDCLPTKHPSGGGATNFDDWIAPIVRFINEQVSQPPPAGKGLPDYRLLPFSEEKALFSLALAQWIEKRGLPPNLFVASSSPLSRDALAILTPYATSVVRAVR